MSDNLENITETLDERKVPFPNRNRPVRQSGVFNLEIEKSITPPPKHEQNTDYVQGLEKEATLWNDLIKAKVKECQIAENTSVGIDEIILTQEQRAYFSGAPNPEKFIHDSEEFLVLADKYLCEHSEFVEKTDNLAKTCKEILDRISYEIIYDCFHKPEI